MKSERFWVAVWHETINGSRGDWIHLHENPFSYNNSAHVIINYIGSSFYIKKSNCSIFGEYRANDRRRAGFLDIETGELFRDTIIEERLLNGPSEV